jgi:hypothetical protein
MSRVCSTHWGDEKCIQHRGWETEGKNHLEDRGVDGVGLRGLGW